MSIKTTCAPLKITKLTISLFWTSKEEKQKKKNWGKSFIYTVFIIIYLFILSFDFIILFNTHIPYLVCGNRRERVEIIITIFFNIK